ncbi:CTP:molybdopterin cytidylyltransferase MocA [Hasllibacter halocynthiae]|uniref:CTP:molybdopterin cytidylyltransferase MocA n=1 Tax=Hasllibacter halocynthiae TaxID=595589 RepID=A0A2T0X860_9RHOB|nr:NTP transferase domain-containing protein [Hasllibacter halocynthiae]PRY95116.1 CTP:molybdopterin cytidylyltransferase MocA [Hasllibacter halocynthiae]
MTVALILAAGASSRMRGRDKLAEGVGGVPLLTRQVRLARAAGLPVHVALPPLPHPREALLDGAAAIEVPRACEGMGRTIATAVRALRDAPAILLLLGDLPALRADDLRAVLTARDASPAPIWRAATGDGRGGHPILFARETFADLMALRGDDGARGVVAAHRAGLVPIGPQARLDLDTPEDWAAFRAAGPPRP